jgi:GTPase SAR1 family protein
VDVRSERGDEIVIMIVGNKTDLSEQRFDQIEHLNFKRSYRF